ncbi:MAG: sugar transferase, partial [Burkholderiaceae bacterium]
MAKRLFDLSISTLALAVLALPMVIIALWVRWDSPGPALYRQVRVGNHGLPFRILKFRTMHRTADRVGVSITVGQD